MAQAAFRRIVMGLAITGCLAGCLGVSGTATDSTTSPATAGATPGQSRSGGAREVEAPEVFQTSDSALWDGRPSLGGIWVASPNAVDPERVVMFNPASGKSVTGALFRRERDNPGPTLQVSSDAADALGMLAGQPTELRVTALRKIEKEAPPAKTPAPAAEPAPVVAQNAAGDGSAEETAALATAAIAATAIAATAVAGTEAATGADAAGVADPDAVDAASQAEPAKPKTWKERRAEARAKRDADKAAAAALAAGETVPAAEDGATPTAESAGVAAVETAPLDARSPEIAAAADAATDAPPAPVKKTRKQIRAEEKAAAEAAAVAEAASAAAPAEAVVAASGRPIQVASFSKEENANRAVEALAKIGITATPQKSEQAGKVVWGVVATGDDALLQSIKGAGFADAYFLK